jgi:hypothetical protein
MPPTWAGPSIREEEGEAFWGWIFSRFETHRRAVLISQENTILCVFLNLSPKSPKETSESTPPRILLTPIFQFFNTNTNIQLFTNQANTLESIISIHGTLRKVTWTIIIFVSPLWTHGRLLPCFPTRSRRSAHKLAGARRLAQVYLVFLFMFVCSFATWL